MVTANLFLKMLSASDEGLDEIIDKLSEADAKAFIKMFITQLKQDNYLIKNHIVPN